MSTAIEWTNSPYALTTVEETAYELLLFQISAVLVGFRREHRYFGFFYLFCYLKFVWEHKKIGSKNFLFIQGWFCRLAPTHILFGYCFLLEEKLLLGKPTSCLPWNVLNRDLRASFLAVYGSWFYFFFSLCFRFYSFLVRSGFRIPGHWKRRRSCR